MLRQWSNSIISILFIVYLSFNNIYCQSKEINTIPIEFRSNGFKISGMFFPSKGQGPFPTVILLHGYPGGEGDLFGLGKRLNQNSINAFTFNYRGTWKSEGIYLPKTSLEDVVESIQFIKSQQMVDRFAIDTSNISIVGYSYGGGFALLGSISDTSVKKVVSIAGGDLSIIARMIEQDDEFRKNHQAFLDRFMSDSTISRGLGGKASHEWLLKYKNDYNLLIHSKELSQKSILFLGGWRDKAILLEDHILPLYRSLQEYNSSTIKIEVFDSDHSFKNVREEIADLIVSWIKDDN